MAELEISRHREGDFAAFSEIGQQVCNDTKLTVNTSSSVSRFRALLSVVTAGEGRCSADPLSLGTLLLI
jgi:hypothetical protein